jgi:hypothetical protein
VKEQSDIIDFFPGDCTAKLQIKFLSDHKSRDLIESGSEREREIEK